MSSNLIARSISFNRLAVTRAAAGARKRFTEPESPRSGLRGSIPARADGPVAAAPRALGLPSLSGARGIGGPDSLNRHRVQVEGASFLVDVDGVGTEPPNPAPRGALDLGLGAKLRAVFGQVIGLPEGLHVRHRAGRNRHLLAMRKNQS